MPRRSRDSQLPLDGETPPESTSGDSFSAIRKALDPASAELAGDDEDLQEFFVPVHGFIRLTLAETRILDHPALQRLGSIHQLGQADLVFRGATHSRLEHSMGVVHVAEMMVRAINANLGRGRRKGVGGATLGAPVTRLERTHIRLASLVHDVGHLPAGHTLEDELGLLDKHDHLRRLNVILDTDQWPGARTPTLRSLIDQEFRRPGVDIPASDLVLALVARAPDGTAEAGQLEELKTRVGRFVRVGVCRDIVGNTICADLLDYLHRDWYHVGKPQYFDDRLLQYMEIRKDSDTDTESFVVSLGQRPKVRTDAVSAILRLLETRYELAETVLFHRTKCSAAAMLERGVQELVASIPPAEREGWSDAFVRRLLAENDQSALDLFLREADLKGAAAAVPAFAGLRQRVLFKGLRTAVQQEFTSDQLRSVEKIYRGPNGAENRLNAVRLLEGDFGLPAGSMAVYFPDKGMNAKIARVKVHLNGSIDEFAKWDERHEDLAGGHLRAQQNRFQQLWRVHFVLKEDVLRGLSPEVLSLLRQSIQECVLGLPLSEETTETASRRIASSLTTTVGTPLAGRSLSRDVAYAAFDRKDSLLFYPTGAPSLKLHLGRDPS